MKQKQVNIPRIQPGKHFVNRCRRLSLAILAGPELCGDPDFLTGNTAFFYGLPDSTLILVSMGSVNMAVACTKSLHTRCLCVSIPRNHIYTKAKLRDFVSII